jgi:hypothetical protein
MEPTRAVKPLWANHPLGSLLYGLMSYSFAFKKNVMDRAGAMAMRSHQGARPALVHAAAVRYAHAGRVHLPQRHLRAAGAVRVQLRLRARDAVHGRAAHCGPRSHDSAPCRRSIRSSARSITARSPRRSWARWPARLRRLAEKMVVKPIQAKFNGHRGQRRGARRKLARSTICSLSRPSTRPWRASAGRWPRASSMRRARGPGSIFPQDREAFIDGMAGRTRGDRRQQEALWQERGSVQVAQAGVR